MRIVGGAPLAVGTIAGALGAAGIEVLYRVAKRRSWMYDRV